MQSIYWVRSDLRIHDNLALNNFCELSKKGLLIWCPTSSYLRAESIRKSFNDQCLTCFSEQLKKYGLSLTVKNKKMPQILAALIATYKIDHIFWTKEFSIEEIKEENAVIQICKQNGITFTALDKVTLIKPADLPFEIKNMPFVFTDFRKSIENNLTIRTPTEDIKLGDLIVTGGLDNIFPKGFPLGVVSDIGKKTKTGSLTIEIKPVVDANKVEEIFIVKQAALENFLEKTADPQTTSQTGNQ